MNNKKGNSFELELSKKFHQRFPACLISQRLLRLRQCGQIDIAYFSKTQLILVEAKSSKLSNVSFYQMRRLRASQEYLSKLLNIPVQLKIEYLQDNEGF